MGGRREQGCWGGERVVKYIGVWIFFFFENVTGPEKSL